MTIIIISGAVRAVAVVGLASSGFNVCLKFLRGHHSFLADVAIEHLTGVLIIIVIVFSR